MLTNYVTGYDHIGVPTNDMDATTKFYEAIGFKMVHEKENNGIVRFFQHGDIIIETYEKHGEATGKRGAIDHIALRVTDVEACAKEVAEQGFKIVEGPNTLPFWENGIRYVCIEGPNTEIVEFLQKL